MTVFHRRSHTFRRLAATLLLAAVAGATLALVACGDGSAPAPASRTLTPDASSSFGKRGATTAPSATPTASTTPSATPTATPSATPTRITDKSIRAAILARIAQEPGLRGFDIRVKVADGTVYLMGRVRTKDQRSLVEQIALTEPGVKKVVSAVDVDDAAGY
jgi:hypothetical protein